MDALLCTHRRAVDTRLLEVKELRKLEILGHGCRRLLVILGEQVRAISNESGLTSDLDAVRLAGDLLQAFAVGRNDIVVCEEVGDACESLADVLNNALLDETGHPETIYHDRVIGAIATLVV